MATILDNIPRATRHLLLINCVVFLAQQVFPSLTFFCSLNYVLTDWFHFWQPFTYMFLHGSLSHLFFNMFALWMFGVVIERTLGTKRFLIFYLLSGIGAALCQEIWQTFLLFGMNNPSSLAPTLGASGAVYAILLAFGMLYPNETIMLLIPPIPMKAKYLIAGFIAIEVISLGIADNVAHFAHLGGMFFGWILLRYWRRRAQRQTSFNGWAAHQRRQARRERFDNLFNKRKTPSQKNTSNLTPDQEYHRQRKETEKRVDAILDKVKSSGYESLTNEEKDFLFNNTK